MNLLSERISTAISEWESVNKRNLSNTDFAKICGVSKQTVGDWIKGRTQSMTGEALLNGADYLKVNPRWLCSGTGPKEITKINDSDGSPHEPVSLYNYEAIDFAYQGLDAFSKVAPLTMADPIWRQMAFSTLYKAWFNEEMRRLGAIPILKLVS